MTAGALQRFAAGSRAIRIPHPERLAPVGRPEGVAIVGATCAGKSTILAAIRAAVIPDLDLPPRFVTRDARAGDSPEETVHLSREAFDEKLRRGEIGWSWVRPMENGREERYGFPPAARGRLPLYSANNALCENAPSVAPAAILDRLLIVGVVAPPGLREARFRARSPDLWRDRPTEAHHRLADRPASELPHVCVVIENDLAREEDAASEAIELMRILVAT